MASLRMLVLAALAVSTSAFTDKAEHKALAKAEEKADHLQSLERTEPAEAGKPSKPFFYPFYPMVRSPQTRFEQRKGIGGVWFVGTEVVHIALHPLRRRLTRMPLQSTPRTGRRPSRSSTRARSRGTGLSRGGRCGAHLRPGWPMSIHPPNCMPFEPTSALLVMAHEPISAA